MSSRLAPRDTGKCLKEKGSAGWKVYERARRHDKNHRGGENRGDNWASRVGLSLNGTKERGGFGGGTRVLVG